MPEQLVGPGFRWAAATLRSNLLGFVLLAAVATIIGLLPIFAPLPGQDRLVACLGPEAATPECQDFMGSSLLLPLGVYLACLVLQFLASIGVYRAALAATRGASPDFAMMLSGQHLGRYVLVTLVSAVLTVAGLFLCILPGLIVYFVLQLAPLFALDRGTRLRESLAASARVIWKAPVPGLAILGVTVVAALISALTFGIAPLLTLPFTALFMAFLYRTLIGEAVR